MKSKAQKRLTSERRNISSKDFQLVLKEKFVNFNFMVKPV